MNENIIAMLKEFDYEKNGVKSTVHFLIYMIDMILRESWE